jgi:HNH endonuclease/NUMOD3 motif
MPTGTYKRTEQHLEIIRKTARRPEVRQKMSLAKRGKKWTERQRIAITAALRARPNPFLGKKHTEETKKKIGEKKKLQVKRGAESNFWKGGITTYARKLYLNSQRRALVRGAQGSFSMEEWKLLKEEYNFTCPACFRSEPEIVLTFDHVVPLVKGGSNYISNIQPLCRSCNAKKHDKLIHYCLSCPQRN